MIRKLLQLVVFISLSVAGAAQSVQQVASPGGQIRIACNIDTAGGMPLSYEVFYKGKVLLRPSALGIQFSGAPTLQSFFKITGIKKKEQRGNWKPVYGEKEV